MILFKFSPLSILIFLLSCSQAARYQPDTLLTYQYGNLPAAESKLTQSIQKEMPKGDYRESGDAVWLLLDRATTRFAEGELDLAIADYQEGFNALDYYTQDDTSDLAAQLLLSDTAAAYVPFDYEQMLARGYFALALLQKRDYGNAFAILRNGEEWQQKQRQGYCKSKATANLTVPDNALVKYLLAALSEQKGDLSNANILYREVEQLTSGRVPYRPAQINKDSGTLLLVCHNGNAPQKISVLTDASVASSFALEMLLSSQNVRPALSSLPGIQTPAFQEWPYSAPALLRASLDNKAQPFIPICDVDSLARNELNQKMPLFVAKGVGRFITRRVAVGYCQKQDELFGALADIGMLVANSMTHADTRCWGTLPYRIDIARFDLPVGKYRLNLEITTSSRHRETTCYDVEVRSNELNVINIFQLHPGITKVLIS